MKKFLLVGFLALVSLSGFCQTALTAEYKVPSDAHPTYTLPDTVSTTEVVKWSKTLGASNRFDNIGVQFDITKIGATTIAGAIVLKVKATQYSDWALIKGGTTTHTITDASQSVYFTLPYAVYAVQGEITGSGSGSYKVLTTVKVQRAGY